MVRALVLMGHIEGKTLRSIMGMVAAITATMGVVGTPAGRAAVLAPVAAMGVVGTLGVEVFNLLLHLRAVLGVGNGCQITPLLHAHIPLKIGLPLNLAQLGHTCSKAFWVQHHNRPTRPPLKQELLFQPLFQRISSLQCIR